MKTQGFLKTRWYGESPEHEYAEHEYAEKCKKFAKGDSVEIDCEQEDGGLENYSDDPEIKQLLRDYSR